MSFISFLFTCVSKKSLIMSVTMGVINGLFSTLMLWLINRSIHEEASPTLYFIFIFLSLFTGLVSAITINNFSEKNIFSIRKKIISLVNDAEFRSLELYGKERIFSAVTQDVNYLSSAASFIPDIIISTSTLIFCIGYIFYLSPMVSIFLLISLLIGSLGYIYIGSFAKPMIKKNRSDFDIIYHYYNDTIYGSREYKYDAIKKNYDFNHIFCRTSETIRKDNISISCVYLAAELWGKAFIYLFIGIIIFFNFLFFDQLHVESSKEILSSIVLITFFCLSSIYTIINGFPIFSRANDSYNRLISIPISIESSSDEASNILSTNTISYVNLCYSYIDVHGNSVFKLGPLDFTLTKGELIFFTGGNGSGKTTLLKLITGIYSFDEGEIFCDNISIKPSSKHRLRELFTVIWSDLYLFDSFVIDNKIQRESFIYWLSKFDIFDKVKISANHKINHQELSIGQRKRLSLAIELSKNLPFIFLDEWAAEQSPDFKEFFYYKVLPELKYLSKGVVVISHDSKYFDVADKVFVMSNGILSSSSLSDFPSE